MYDKRPLPLKHDLGHHRDHPTSSIIKHWTVYSVRGVSLMVVTCSGFGVIGAAFFGRMRQPLLKDQRLLQFPTIIQGV